MIFRQELVHILAWMDRFNYHNHNSPLDPIFYLSGAAASTIDVAYDVKQMYKYLVTKNILFQ